MDLLNAPLRAWSSGSGAASLGGSSHASAAGEQRGPAARGSAKRGKEGGAWDLGGTEVQEQSHLHRPINIQLTDQGHDH